jgi:hypothetical protein
LFATIFKVLAFEGIEAISTLYSTQAELVSEYPDVEPGGFAQQNGGWRAVAGGASAGSLQAQEMAAHSAKA